MKFIVSIIIILALTATVQRIMPQQSALPGSEAILALGFILVAAYLFGKIIFNFRLPKITGYLLAGILFGPYFLNYVSQTIVIELRLIDNIALSLIALTAGGEFRIATIKTQWQLLARIISWQILIVFAGVTLGCMLLKPFIPLIAPQPFTIALGASLILGALAIAKSPATTIAIITETRARGPYTDVILGVTVAKDIIVVLVFAFILAFAKPLIVPGEDLHFQYLVKVLGEILQSLGTGLISGYLIYAYIRYVKAHLFLFLLGYILLIIELSAIIHIEIILVFMMAGFIVQNFSKQGDNLIHAIENNSLPIYVMFFAIAGASLNFQIFLDNWMFTLILVGLRMGTTQIGTWMGAQLSSANILIRKYGWLGFIGQAGVTLGLAIIVDRTIPGAIGENIKSIIIATIAINQILGPVLFRYGLGKTGEIRTPVS